VYKEYLCNNTSKYSATSCINNYRCATRYKQSTIPKTEAISNRQDSEPYSCTN
jgi:hypothetical protein